MAEILEVIQLGHPLLRSQAQLVDNIQSPRIQNLLDNLIATVIKANGVGIAAPQVQSRDRIFIVASRPNPRYPNAPEMEPTPMINPRVLASSSEEAKGWEGCLSIPGIRGLVPRHQAIEIEYSDRNGKLHKQELTNFVARIFQHELDHLDGIVFIDRLQSTQDLITEQEYQKLLVENKPQRS